MEWAGEKEEEERRGEKKRGERRKWDGLGAEEEKGEWREEGTGQE